MAQQKGFELRARASQILHRISAGTTQITHRFVHRIVVDGDTATEQGPPQLVVPGVAFDEACTDSLVVAIDPETR